MEERHPIPQNVTGFQFKLIGDMTLKQFGYLAGCALVATFFYLLPIPIFLRWPFIVFFVLFGIMLAFIPYQGRPLDRWIINFFRAVFSTSQYIYKTPQPLKQPVRVTSVPIPPAPQPPPQPANPPQTLPPPEPTLSVFNAPKFVSVKAEGQLSPEEKPQMQPRPSVQIPQTPPLQVGVTQTPREESFKAVTAYRGDRRFVEKRIAQLLVEKERLEREILVIQDQMRKKQTTLTSQAHTLPQNIAPSADIPSLPQFPNLLTGIVRDIKGNVLPNILIEVKDENGNLIRAFKTNKLGQFAAATQMGDGKYVLEIEDPQEEFKFEPISLVLEGKIVPPLEIKNLDIREELRRRIFSQ